MSAAAGTTGRAARSTGLGRYGDWVLRLVPALLAYVPLLLTRPGEVGADTKTYLYLDPGRLLGDAPYLWDSGVGAGTVTHQNIGYLWPMGPWYWLFEQAGVPDWVAQRLWLGTVMVAAALGVQFLLRTLGWRQRSGILVASLAYMLSPYLLHYEARISVILLPWAALGWVVALTVRALRNGGWRDPAILALVLLTAGGTNATALVMIAPAPALWIVWALFVERETDLRTALAAVGRIATLVLATSLWWMAGLWAQGRFGLPVLRYTETYRTVAEEAVASEVLRGLGYWFFYGRDKLGPWIEPSVEYTNRSLLLGVSYLVPTLAVAAAAFTRWRHKAYFLALVVVGTLLAVGAHPWDNSSPAGGLFKAFTRTDAGLALRSTPRAIPLVALGLAVCLGAGVSAIARRTRRGTFVATGLVGALLLLNLSPLWNGTMVPENLKRDEALPAYWLDATHFLDERDDGTRVLEVPGSDFASYRWGNTVDPITPGLMDRPYLARELFAYGSAPSMALLIALDEQLQEDQLAPETLAPLARLLGVGDVALRSDLQYERFGTPRPRLLWADLLEADGLGEPEPFGEPTPNVAGPELPLIDEVELGNHDALTDPPPVAVFPVEDPVPIVRATSPEAPLLLAGGANGVVSLAEAGLLRPDQVLLYAATVAGDPTLLDAQLDQGAVLVVTDSNRRRGRRWGTLQQGAGYTEEAGQEPVVYDPTDKRLDVFPGTGDDARTVAEHRGGVHATATSYGNPVTFTPGDRPPNAVDGDPLSAWRTAAFSDARGERLILDFDEPLTVDHLDLAQPTTGIINRVIDEVRLDFDDGGPPVDVALDHTSETEAGQRVDFPTRTFDHLEIEVTGTTDDEAGRFDGASAVGFSEVRVGDVVLDELIRPPVDLLDAVGDDDLDHELLVVFRRERTNPAQPIRQDPEIAIRRVFSLPSERAFDLSGTVRLDPDVDAPLIDELLGLPGEGNGGVTVDASIHLPGDARSRATTVLDGDSTTGWSPSFHRQDGHYLQLDFSEPVDLDELSVEVATDGRHSVPRQLILVPDGDAERAQVLDLGELPDDPDSETTEVTVEVDPVTVDSLQLVIGATRDVETTDWYSFGEIALPVSIREIAIDGVGVPDPDARLDSGCRDDLLRIDDEPVPVQVTGTTEAALRGDALDLHGCAEASEGVSLAAGEHTLVTAPGRDVGLGIDQLTLTSAVGGAALPVADANRAERSPVPTLQVDEKDLSRTVAQVDEADEPFWLVLGQSYSDGWEASIDGRSLGAPVLVDGYANGWLIDPADHGTSFTVELAWRPQRVVTAALVLSALGVLACLALIALPRRRTPLRRSTDDARPRLTTPFAATGPRPTRSGAALGATLVTVLAALALPPPPLLALPVGIAAYGALRWRRGGAVLALAAAAVLAGAGMLITVEQVRNRYPPEFTWPQNFDHAHVLGLLVILLLAGQVAVEVLHQRRLPGRLPSDHDDPAGPPADQRDDDDTSG